MHVLFHFISSEFRSLSLLLLEESSQVCIWLSGDLFRLPTLSPRCNVELVRFRRVVQGVRSQRKQFRKCRSTTINIEMGGLGGVILFNSSERCPILFEVRSCLPLSSCRPASVNCLDMTCDVGFCLHCGWAITCVILEVPSACARGAERAGNGWVTACGSGTNFCSDAAVTETSPPCAHAARLYYQTPCEHIRCTLHSTHKLIKRFL